MGALLDLDQRPNRPHCKSKVPSEILGVAESPPRYTGTDIALVANSESPISGYVSQRAASRRSAASWGHLDRGRSTHTVAESTRNTTSQSILVISIDSGTALLVPGQRRHEAIGLLLECADSLF